MNADMDIWMWLIGIPLGIMAWAVAFIVVTILIVVVKEAITGLFKR